MCEDDMKARGRLEDQGVRVGRDEYASDTQAASPPMTGHAASPFEAGIEDAVVPEPPIALTRLYLEGVKRPVQLRTPIEEVRDLLEDGKMTVQLRTGDGARVVIPKHRVIDAVENIH